MFFSAIFYVVCPDNIECVIIKLMKQETIKEVGKLFIDLAKIIFAIAILVPLVKGSSFQLIAILPALLSVVLGTYLINKGV